MLILQAMDQFPKYKQDVCKTISLFFYCVIICKYCQYSAPAFFVYYENADLVYDVIRMRQLSKQTLHELSPNDNS